MGAIQMKTKLILATVVVFMIVLSGCGRKDHPATNNPSEVQENKKKSD
jgi:hypothetical protein